MQNAIRHVFGVARLPAVCVPVWAVLVVLTMVMTACSTTEGFGKDVKNLGGGIEDSAARNK